MDEVRPKLLLADDSVTIRKVVELTFADEGIDVTTAADAETAMQKFVDIQPDIVLVAVGLAGTSGYRICEMIKNDEATRHLPVLLLVGSFEPFDQNEAERVGADGFLTKPFHSIRDLVDRVSDLLGRADDADTALVGANGDSEPPLTADIDNLYNNSFAETVQMDKLDTVDDLLGDSGMDDEMIETSYPSEVFEDNTAFDSPEDRLHEFDWSSGSMVNELGPIRPTGTALEPKIVTEQPDDPVFTVSDEPSVDANTVENIPAIARDNGLDEPSPELITLLTQRVIERLSDRIIREIARDAVPRIAEKLIREALNQEKKT